MRIQPLENSTFDAEDLPKNVSRNAEGLEFVNSIKGGVIPNEYIPAVQKGIVEAMSRGILAGYPLINVQADLYDGTYHEVDSSEVAFKVCASQAFQDAVKQAQPKLLEPMMKVEVVVPSEFIGDVTGDLSSKRGIIDGTENKGMVEAIRAIVPLSEMFGYMNQLRSMTSGRGTFTMEFARYDIVPQNVADEIIKKRTA